MNKEAACVLCKAEQSEHDLRVWALFVWYIIYVLSVYIFTQPLSVSAVCSNCTCENACTYTHVHTLISVHTVYMHLYMYTYQRTHILICTAHKTKKHWTKYASSLSQTRFFQFCWFSHFQKKLTANLWIETTEQKNKSLYK